MLWMTPQTLLSLESPDSERAGPDLPHRQEKLLRVASSPVLRPRAVRDLGSSTRRTWTESQRMEKEVKSRERDEKEDGRIERN